MVNTRKPSGLAPMPPNSRTNSTTNTSKTKNKRAGTSPAAGRSPTAVETTSSPEIKPKTLSDVTVKVAGKEEPVGPEFDDPPRFVGGPKMTAEKKEKDVPAKASKVKSKSKKPLVKSPPSSYYYSVIKNTVRTIIFLSLVSYTLVVCPLDTKRESPVCLGVHDVHVGLNNYLLKPYVTPRLHRLLAHPQVKPIVDPVVRISSPVIDKATPFVQYAGAQLNYQYVKHSSQLSKTVRRTSAPYVKQLDDHYKLYFAPHVNKYVTPVVSSCQVCGRYLEREVQPYLIRLSVLMRQKAIQAKPYIVVMWVEAQKVPGLLKDHVWDPLMELRRMYVDPQLSKMIKAVEESTGSNGDSKASSTGFEKTFMARAEQTVNSKRRAPVVEQEILGEEEDPLMTSGTEPPSPTPEQLATHFEEDESTITAEDHVDDKARVLSKMKKADMKAMDDDELAAFLRELTEEKEAAKPEAEQVPETDEQIAERKRQKDAETAEKRAEIDARHSEWEAKVEALKKELLASYAPILAESRKKAVQEVKAMDPEQSVQADADKSLSGIEAYVKKLMSENTTGGAEKVALLDNLVNKVKEKFNDSLEAEAHKIIQWIEKTRKAEGDDIEILAEKLKTLGTEAQADLGLDYAWLDDVTVKDWARYHALLDAAEAFKKHLVELANGSSPDSLPNPINMALRTFQIDLQNVALGFQFHVDKAHKRGLNVMLGRPGNFGEDEEDETTAEDEVEPEATAEGIPTETDEPEVSILPVPDKEEKEHRGDEAVDNSQHVFMQKGKEQVEQAVKMAEEAARGRDEL